MSPALTRAAIAMVTGSAFAFGCGAVSADTAKDLAAIIARADACVKKDGTDAGMKECSADAYLATDGVLNSIYKAATEKLKRSADADDQEVSKRLLASERAWVAYRDAECRLQGIAALGGTAEALEVEGCLVMMTEERVKNLERLLKER